MGRNCKWVDGVCQTCGDVDLDYQLKDEQPAAAPPAVDGVTLNLMYSLEFDDGGDFVVAVETSNTALRVDLLFSRDGCNVYRFVDEGRTHYFASCERASISTVWTHCQPVGKTVVCYEKRERTPTTVKVTP